MARRWRILGALGTGPFAPVLAEQHWDGNHRQVVLSRPALPDAVQMARCLHPVVLAECDAVSLRGRDFGIRTYVPGRSIAQLLDRHPEGLPAGVLARIAVEVLGGLKAAPVSHGALSASRICVGRDGYVRVWGFTGRAADDCSDLADLCEDWGAPSEGLLDALRRGDVESARDQMPEGPDLQAFVGEAPDLVLPHPWQGEELTESDPEDLRRTPARTAAFAALALALGFASGWVYRP